MTRGAPLFVTKYNNSLKENIKVIQQINKQIEIKKEEIELKSVQFIPIGKSRKTLERMKKTKRGYLLPLLEQEERQLM